MLYEITDTSKAAALVGSWEETLIWSCLQGIMGKLYGDDPAAPTSAMAMIGDFTFFAGKPDIECVSCKPDWCNRNFMIMVPQTRRWTDMILHVYGDKAAVISRYATKKEPHTFHKETLEAAVASLPEGCRLSMIDEPLYRQCKSEKWSADLVSQFPDYDTYRKLGIGAVITRGNTILSGASSYSRYKEGIEIEIDTREEYRRRGLAYICGAKLILECLKRNLYPSWDAHNKGSLALAEKLGYQYSHTYTAIEICGY